MPLRLYVAERHIVLPALAVNAPASRCGRPADGTTLALLLAEAQKAIALTQATLDSRRLVFSVETWTRHVGLNLRTLDSSDTPAFDRGWPIRSAPADSLRIWGFVRDEPDSADNPVTAYYGPDAAVMFADWFLSTRCLRIVRRAGSAGLITLEFSPVRRRTTVDIAGRLTFDSASLALKRLDFTWVGLPDWVPAEGPAGSIDFDRLPGGEWLTRSWSLRVPVPEVFQRRVRLREYLDTGGLGRRSCRSERRAPPGRCAGGLRDRPRVLLASSLGPGA